ncbi:MAG: hypothetical protein KIS94_05595 [Chitinophagales bacterium]|nr:hypothetical protein [Chitinophagales bacterium]
MKDFFAKNWVVIMVVVVVIILLVVTYFYAIQKGKDSTAPAIPGDNPGNPLTDAEKTKVKSITDRLIADIYGLTNPLFRDWPAYNELATSSDKIFVAVCNLYKKEKNVSLKTDMQGESYWLDQAPWGTTDIIQLIFDRFNSLNLN